MKLTPPLALLLALLLFPSQAQVRKDNPKRSKPIRAEAKAPRAEPSARTVVCIDPGHPSEVASGRDEQNGTNETRVAWEVALKLREAQSRGYIEDFRFRI